ncbi:DUF4198 domain-containing protein [Photobacterium lutimaris]|uniref:DUF4198 domain-containing protein n=1 Tax=Photobacterium lutimaris TaxID=388278 RepID=A0A2T3J499_9GAMM|nr:DUF4198 domain-containing protein [Photobacterium lutimaris]PSU36073.1 DUF4198 domain-containing protein [Photobacterium lutimaris]TDR79174.1 putative GH25 family protein [Photobacterium lutimaris]
MIKRSQLKAATVACALLAGMAVSATANAHPRWILPSHFTVSKEGGDWLTFDVTASHGTFVFDKPAGSETGQIVMPDGRIQYPSYVTKGKRRSVFDFYFEEDGTHKVRVNNVPSYYTQYKAGRRDTVKWVKAHKAERDEVLPKKSRDVITQISYTRAETYVTVGKPTEKAFEIEGKYLELVPVTHPADIVEGEEVTFQFFFNGEPQQGVTAEITREGTLYRNHQEQIDVVSDDQGLVSFVPEHAGRWLMKANYKGDLENNALADRASVNVHLTFEAVLQ